MSYECVYVEEGAQKILVCVSDDRLDLIIGQTCRPDLRAIVTVHPFRETYQRGNNIAKSRK